MILLLFAIGYNYGVIVTEVSYRQGRIIREGAFNANLTLKGGVY